MEARNLTAYNTMHPDLRESYRYCEHISSREGSNFYGAFGLLPEPQRLAMCALYAFLRLADDLTDQPRPVEEKRVALAGYREGLQRALVGEYTLPLFSALHHTIRTFGIPTDYLYAALDGVEMDLGPVSFESFAELRRYCWHVASVVGLSCLHIWGFKAGPVTAAPARPGAAAPGVSGRLRNPTHQVDPSVPASPVASAPVNLVPSAPASSVLSAPGDARDLAEQAGIAFQLTNILRDLGEDAARGRVYLPRDEIQRFGYDLERLQRGQRDAAFRDLMRFQVERARKFYEAAWPLRRLLHRPGRAVFLLMARTYRSLLEAIERCDYDVFSHRIRVSPLRKLWLGLSILPVRWGWL